MLLIVKLVGDDGQEFVVTSHTPDEFPNLGEAFLIPDKIILQANLTLSPDLKKQLKNQVPIIKKIQEMKTVDDLLK